MKKVIKITGITILIIITLLIAIPFAFQGKIQGMVKHLINKNLNAKVEFSSVSLSFLQNFPQAQISISDLVITNFEPFKDETLATAKNIAFSMSVKEFFKNTADDPIVVKSIEVDEILLTLKTDKFGHTNYDIAKKSKTESTKTKSNDFSFSLEDYNINNSAISYIDDLSKTTVHISELNHGGNATFSSENSELDTETNANISFSIDSTNYLNNNAIKLDAIIGLDSKNKKYTFKKNKAFVNKLPLEFSGFVQIFEEQQKIDITFENPESSFKDFLAVIPKTYSKNIDNVETTGNFKVKGSAKGIISDNSIPHLDISILSDNASFKYPNLPKRVEQISINTSIKNTTGKTEDTYVNINKLNFKIDEDTFKSSGTLKNITKNMLINANIDGVLNLSNITKVYPIDLENTLTGILKAKINTSFDMDAIKKNSFERIKNNGSASINNFTFSSKDIVNPISISQANMSFNPSTVSLNNFKAKTGKSDLSATGTINNLLGFLLSNNNLQGNFNVNSTVFKISDFMSADDDIAAKNKTTADHESLKIPSFLDCTINANAKTVIYDDLSLKNVKGSLLIKNQQARLKDMTSSIFDGTLSITGDVSTKNKIPTFNLKLGANSFDISESFNNMPLLQSLAPIAKVLQGKLNADINLSGDLDQEFSPNLSTITGNALTELLSSRINANKGELFNKLEGAFSFINFNKLNLKNLKTKLQFANGNVIVNPFDLTYEDIAITVSGSHSFDKVMNYNAVFNVPAKYLGSEITQLINKVDTQEAKKITVPVTANITGDFTKPKVKTDLTNSVSNLTKQLLEIQKQKMLNKGKDKAKDLLENVLNDNKTKTDSIKQQQNNTIKDVLGDIIGNNKTTNTSKDSTQTTKPTTQDAVKSVLGGLLGGKKND